MQERSRPRLFIASSPREAWNGALRAWFDRVLPKAWKHALPSVVVVPTRAQALAFRQRLLDNDRSHLGLRFVTPAGLRELLLARTPHRLARCEDLRLLLAICAEELLQTPPNEWKEEIDQLAAKAVVRTPDHLLRSLERLTTAGWNFDSLALAAFEPIVRRFRQQLAACGFNLVAETDRTLQRDAPGTPLLIENLLVTGFDGAHWSHWPLLRGAVKMSSQATVLLEYPRGEIANADVCWIGSWEEAIGEAEPIHATCRTASDDLFSEAEMRGSKASFHFAVGADATEQARAVALLCQRFLAEESCTRIAVVFGRGGSLPRLVADVLATFEIPHNDVFGRPVPGLFESAEWAAWLQLQRGPRIHSLLRFLNALPQRDELFPAVSMQRFERKLRAAFSEILIDDLEILLEFCSGSETADALRGLVFLPVRATLAQFLAATKNAFAHLRWNQHWFEVARRIGAWTNNVAQPFSRRLFLRWLEESAVTFSATRGGFGEHPYARVQLLTVPQAQGEEWSHLIFAGMNEGSWPPPDRGEFARDEEIEAFNRSIQQLNRAAAREGRQGEGHCSIREGHALYLGPAEQRQIALRQFDALIDTTTESIALTASLVQESAPDRLWNPSELFTQRYQQAQRQPLTQEALQTLQRTTAAWLRDAKLPMRADNVHALDVAETRYAFDARRDVTRASGEYDFALRAPASRVPVLSVSEFERLISAPALVWMKRYLGVEAEDDDTNPWSAATGQWVHRWLASIGGKEASARFVARPDRAEIDQRVRRAADEKCAEVTQLCQRLGKRVPDWWNSGWQNAFCLSRVLAAKLSTIDDWPWMAAEWEVDHNQPIIVGESSTLLLRGRIDLLLSRSDTCPDSFAATELWIFDYKTGASKRSLGSIRDEVEKRRARLRKKLLDGTALQLALYGFAARTRGADSVLLSLLSPAVRPVDPQLSLDDIERESDIFDELARMQQTGVFGMHGPLRSAWSYTRAYPLATLAIEPDVLEQRWQRTHPQLVREEEEIYWS